MRNSQRSSHGSVVAEFIVAAFFQAHCGVGFEHCSYVVDELGYAWADFAGVDADDHAFWGAGAGFLWVIVGIGGCGTRTDVSPLFDARFGHYCRIKLGEKRWFKLQSYSSSRLENCRRGSAKISTPGRSESLSNQHFLHLFILR